MQENKQNESRVKKTLLNARVNLLFYFLILVLSFFSRKFFLQTLGASFIGLTGTLQNLLTYLNLAELGIATAIGYVLYKPLFEKDYEKINEIISVFGYLYRWIGQIILIAGIILSAFIPLIFPNTKFELPLIYFAFYSFLASSLIGYFLNYKQTLLGADQRNFVVTAYFQGGNIVKVIIQMVSAYYTGSYYLWVAIELFFGIIYSIILNWKINQVYPWLKSEIKEGKRLFKKYPEVIRYTKQLFVQQISAIVQWHTVPFLTYAFASLSTVAFYGNYTIITDKLSQFVNTFIGSTSAGVGNLIAEGNKEKIINVFWELLSVRYFIGGVISFCIYMLIEPFINLWLGEEYILPQIVLILIVINVFISYTRDGVIQFLYGYGLFRDVWAAIAEIIINLSVACICGHFWGLPGVLLGGIVSQILIVGIWKPYFLYTYGFKQNVYHYWVKLFLIIGVTIFPMFVLGDLFQNWYISKRLDTWFGYILYAVCVFLSYCVITFGLLFSVIKQFRFFVGRFVAKIGSIEQRINSKNI
ncbi:MAG: sugar transporter [Bacteroidaceae bacterium]|nr:sugar transporter [Bacteroidaceae bacterium]